MDTIKDMFSTLWSPINFIYRHSIPNEELAENHKNGAIWLGIAGLIASIAAQVLNALPAVTTYILQGCSISLLLGGLTSIPIFILAPLLGLYSYGTYNLGLRIQQVLK